MASVLVVIYEDILEFHQAALRVFKRPSKILSDKSGSLRSNSCSSMEATIQICMEGFQNSVSTHPGRSCKHALGSSL